MDNLNETEMDETEMDDVIATYEAIEDDFEYDPAAASRRWESQPGLLAACETLMELWGSEIEYRMPHAYRKIKAAIAKAG